MTTDKTAESKRPTLGVVAISKNEETDLPGFISHLEPWVDEIIIVDDGSTDDTLRILENDDSQVKLVEQLMDPESGFAGQRNRGIKETKSDWLLHMDIDERVPPDLASEMLEAISNNYFHAFRYHRLNFFLHRPMKAGGFADWNNPHLARRGLHHFENAVHETCIIEDDSAAIGQLKARMWHLNDASYKERMGKSFVYCQNQSKRLVARGLKIKWYHLLFLPMIEFLYKFILKQGFRDRTPGLLFAIHAACAMFRACALVWDRQNPKRRDNIEKIIGEMWVSADIDAKK